MKLTVYVGYDSSNLGQKLANRICIESIKKFNPDVKVVSLIKKDLEDKNLFYRPEDSTASTEFTYTRFLVPYLNNYEGIAVFCDSDFLYKCNIEELLQYYNPNQAVMCVKHNQKSLTTKKFSGRPQSDYPRKNWSSLMLFNCAHPSCKNLDLKTVNEQTPAYLHRMQWCNDNEIGEIPYQYNYLLGYYFTDDAKVIHYTEGGPWHNEWYNGALPNECINLKYGNEWLHYLKNDEGKNLLLELNGEKIDLDPPENL